MKKLLTLITAFTMGVSAFAGGLLTNTNQSVHFLRNPAQDASTDIDAAYSNPAGLIYLTDGFHFSLTNQSAFQTRTVTSTFAPFAAFGGNATKVYEANTKAVLIPSFQAAYKKNKLALSASFAVIGACFYDSTWFICCRCTYYRIFSRTIPQRVTIYFRVSGKRHL